MEEIKVWQAEILMSGETTSPFELIGIKDTFLNRIKFRNKLYIFNYNLKEFLDSKTEDYEYQSCGIKIPLSIDNISFKNMMSLQSYNSTDKGLSEVMGERIALATTEFNNTSLRSIEYKVKNMPFKEAMGLLNWLNKALKDSQQSWEERFLSVYVTDKDYEQAGGHAMKQFNVINTIKNTCHDFNIPYEKAWDMPYSVVQTNSYAKATFAYIQDQMEQIKTARMKAQQKAPH